MLLRNLSPGPNERDLREARLAALSKHISQQDQSERTVLSRGLDDTKASSIKPPELRQRQSVDPGLTQKSDTDLDSRREKFSASQIESDTVPGSIVPAAQDTAAAEQFTVTKSEYSQQDSIRCAKDLPTSVSEVTQSPAEMSGISSPAETSVKENDSSQQSATKKISDTPPCPAESGMAKCKTLPSQKSVPETESPATAVVSSLSGEKLLLHVFSSVFNLNVVSTILQI